MNLANLVVSSFNFDLVPPFYFLRLNCNFSVCENFPNSSFHFWKHKSVVLQILHQYSMPSNIASLKFVKFLKSILKQQVNFSSNFASIFIFMTHDSSVNYKLINFLLWIIGFHQSPNCESFECPSENLPNS